LANLRLCRKVLTGLGLFMSRHLIVSDVHENIEALKSAVQIARDQHGGFDDIWCLGDVVGYHDGDGYQQIRDAENYIECLEFLRDQGALAIRGNWEQWMFTADEGRTPGTDEPRYQKLLISRRAQIENRHLLDYVRSWPLSAKITNFTLYHATPPLNDAERYWEPYLGTFSGGRIADIFSNNVIETSYFLFGHTHTPCFWDHNSIFTKRHLISYEEFGHPIKINKNYNLQFAINPGSVGEGRDAPSTAMLLNDTIDELSFLYFQV
jgi:predicted phosphodiesterase